MRSFIQSFVTILVLMLAAVFTFAQPSPDPAIQFQSGNFVPLENVRGLTRKSEVFAGGKFQDAYYVVIQFHRLPTGADKQRLKDNGIRLMDYLPSNAYLASVSEDAALWLLEISSARAVFRLAPEHKTPPALLLGQFPAHAIKEPGTVDITVTTFEAFTSSQLAASFDAIGARIIDAAPLFKNVTVRIAIGRYRELLNLPFVLWAEAVDAPNKVENLLGRTLHRVNVLNDGVRNLKGEGINVGIWDESEVDDHIDFSPLASRLFVQDAGTPSLHSTHCGGTIAGRGIINPKARGMAPRSSIYSWNFAGNIQSEMAAGIPAFGLSVSSHSYGSTQTCFISGAGVAYSTTSRNTDLNLNNFPHHLHVHSAGNSQGACTGGWSTITGSGKTAKNNILVANINTNEGISGTSSFGPIADGRVKPEISAFGTNVLSTYPNNQYGTISGTSMATPGVAGTVALLVERYRQLNSDAEPVSSLIKNSILNTAQDLGTAGPDYKFGYGRLNALSAVRILEENRYAVNTLVTGGTNDLSINVPAGTAKLRVMITWNDPAALPNANPALVNNLDLTVINGANSTLPWILDPSNPANAATRAVDNVSNIEQVTIDNPVAGAYTLRVAGTSVPTGPQQYSLTWSVQQPAVEVIFPNGNESFSPGAVETITWDNEGVAGPQTVEYSLDNGANWTVISSTVPPNSTRLNWTIPAANTALALIRVKSGALSDISDATFKILSVPGALSPGSVSCSAGELEFNWASVANATHYDLLKLDPATGEFTVAAANIAATSYTVTGLIPSSSHWFSLVAKNNTTGAVSERSTAANFTVPVAGLGTITAINGSTTVCGPTANVVYSVAPVTGATSYTWTVAPPATIVNGQGTNSITVSYTGVPFTGTVSVFGSSGACRTDTVILSVVAGPAIAAPVSGGNQSVTHCAPNAMPILTATATVPTGHTLLWYDMPANGNIVSNPVLNSYGSITYYAAAVSSSSNCQSAVRTAVTLTINQAPLPVITAGGALTFCEGRSVQLTATAGLSYNWSNGATTQSVTITSGGTYTVTVDQGNGCASTSNPVVVTVNPIPAVTITAGGPTTFCQGGSVILTSSTANSYLWNNGATTQSVTINTTGDYSVMVDNGNGCTNSSATVPITVNPLPTVNLTAAPYTRLFPGLNTTLTANASNAGSYEWFRNGEIVTGANVSSLTVNVDQLGDYSVKVTAPGGCSQTSAIVSISDSAVARLFIYPNPNNGLFQVSYYNQVNSRQTITIFDGKGANVYSKTFNLSAIYQRMEIDLRRNHGGLYTIVLTDRNGKKIATGSVLVR